MSLILLYVKIAQSGRFSSNSSGCMWLAAGFIYPCRWSCMPSLYKLCSFDFCMNWVVLLLLLWGRDLIIMITLEAKIKLRVFIQYTLRITSIDRLRNPDITWGLIQRVVQWLWSSHRWLDCDEAEFGKHFSSQGKSMLLYCE